MCLHNTPHQRSEKSAILHLSNEYKWMMIVGHWEWRCNLTVGWPSLMWNRAAHANTHLTLTVTHTYTHTHTFHVLGWGGFFASHYSHSVVTFDETFVRAVAVFLSRSLTQMFYLIGGSERGVNCCCHRNWRLARLSHHSFVMGLVPAQFERNLLKLIKGFWAVLRYR